MGLDGSQKNYIKRNIRNLPTSKIASDLGIPENEVLEYLKKKWSREKYDRFMRNRFSQTSSPGQNAVSFSFTRFFSENRLMFALLALLVFAVYANSLGNGFVSDDIEGILKNENIGRFSSIFVGNMHFSPLSLLQFIAYHIGGLHPFTFRIINIFLHLGSTFLVYIILSLALKKRVAVIAASIFAVHPILIESVGWISGAPYSLYAFFFLLSFLFYLFSEVDRKYFVWSIVFFILSIFASEKAVVLFLVFALYELTFGNLKYNLKKIVPFFTASVIMLILFVAKIGTRVSQIESSTYQGVAGEGLYNPLIQIPVALGSYLKLIFWPGALTLYQTEMAFNQVQYAIFVLVLLAYLGAVAWSYFKNKTIFFWLVFFLIALLPTLTPFKISWVVAERYVYLGALGIIVSVAILFDKILDLNENAKMVASFFLVVIVASLSVRTIIRNMDWKNEDTIWFATARVAPSGQQIHNNLGDVYMRQGNPQKAIEEFQKAIEINPNYADAYHNLAHVYDQVGQNDVALQYYQKALEINPNLWQSYQNMASIFFNAGQFGKAEESIKKALEINPNDPNLQQNLQVIQAQMQGQ